VELDVRAELASGRYWHGARLAPPPRGTGPLPAEQVLDAALAAEGLREDATVEALLRRARGGDSLPEFVALAARADERAGRWALAERRYRRLVALEAAPEPMRAAAAVRLAVVLERAGARDSAVAAWRRAALALPEIADWFALRRAELTRDTAVAFAIISGAHSAATIQRARRFVGQRRLAAGAARAALDVFHTLQLPFDAARAELALGRRRAARARIDSVLLREAARPAGLLAATFLTEHFDSLGAGEYLAVARAYRAHRDPVAAERYARRALARGRRTDPEPWLLLASLATERGNHAAAVVALDSARGRAGRRAVTRVARARVEALAAAGRWPEADSLVRALVASHPGDSNVAATVLLLADRHRARREDAAETRRYWTLVRRFGGTRFGNVARLRLGLMRYAAGRGDSALPLIASARWRDSSRALGIAPAYWEARLRLEAGDSAALDVLRRLAASAPASYYGTRARELLGDTTLAAPGPVPPPRPGSFPPARARERIALLAAVGFTSEARAEAVGWIRDTTASVQLLLAAAGAATEWGYAREAIALGEAAQARAGTTVEVARALFPFSYRDLIEAEAAEHCVDPRLLAALIRQESRFDPNAISRAGALGIGQVMPQTGERLAGQLGLGGFDRELLFVPDFNLHLGARYLADRLGRDGLPVYAALAAYNAGPTRVGRWRAWPEFRDVDLFVERIPINETRQYVRIVYASWLWYRYLYEGPAWAGPVSAQASP
jgi:soluble lytic murein transglycosylase